MDHCLEKPIEAEALYARALDAEPRLAPKERAEAEFAMARARALDGRAEAASKILEALAERAGEPGLGQWPAKARKALDRVASGEAAFAPEVRGRAPLSIEATAKPLVELLRELSARASVSFELDPSCPESWTVSAFLSDLTLDELMDKLVGQGRWRRVGDAIAIGDVAANGPAWDRGWAWAAIDDKAGRAVGARLCSTRVSLTLPGTTVSDALARINALGICEASVAAGYGDKTVRIYAKDLRLDHALDLIAVPSGLCWTIAGGKVILAPRKEKTE